MSTNGIIEDNMARKLSNFLYLQQSNCGQSCNVVRSWTWDLPQIIVQNVQFHKYAVLILNRPVVQNQNFLTNFWNNAAVRITVDGGTVKWDTFLCKLTDDVNKTMKAPDLITGDFDSITDEVLEKFKKKGCKVVHTPDQDYTDFTKALIELHKHCQENKIELEHIIAIGQNSGRLDHILGNIQTLFLARDSHLLSPNMRLYIISDDSVSWLLSPGDHKIDIPEESRKHKRAWCSLVPIGETCHSVTTSGLKWNLDKQPLQFGKLVSTSNTFDGSEKVTVNCSHTILWSMRIPSVAS